MNLYRGAIGNWDRWDWWQGRGRADLNGVGLVGAFAPKCKAFFGVLDGFSQFHFIAHSIVGERLTKNGADFMGFSASLEYGGQSRTVMHAQAYIH